MNNIVIPKHYNYISAFLTFACNMSCSYCINKQDNDLYPYKTMSAKDWVKGLNRIQTDNTRPITITGGEGTRHPGFYDIINGIDKEIPLDLLTNGKFDVDEFMKKIPPDRLKRDAPYASIRFSFHPGQTRTSQLICVVSALQDAGYSVGIWAVDNGDYEIKKFKNVVQDFNIDFRMKELLDETHGTYMYPDAVTGKKNIKVNCYPSEMLISPSGHIYRCHYELYHNINPRGHILDDEISFEQDTTCYNYGLCNRCDIKGPKFDRFQNKIHCAVRIEKECDEKQN